VPEHFLIELTAILVLGIAAQWLAWRIHMPAILVLLIVGFIAGPATGVLDPDALFGDLLLPIISASVAIILFEGGLGLSLREIREIGAAVRNLVTIGVAVTWVLSAAAAYWLLDLGLSLSILLGAIFVVTGPTVILPLLREVRPAARVGSAVKWEGIVNDPIGAILAVLVFEAIVAGGVQRGAEVAALGVLKAALVGVGVGVAGALVLIVLLKRYWIPDFLQNPFFLMLVVGAFTAANTLQTESGLLAVTVMGAVLANQRAVTVKHIAEFKENLRTLLISVLFIILAARLPVSELDHLGLGSALFLVLLIVVVRPAAVALSTVGSDLSWRERAFIAWMAPRGIVAAAVASIFALRLVDAGYPQAERLVVLTFLVITGTVAVYGLTAGPVARALQVARPNPQGALLVGAHAWARSLARALQEMGYEALLVDANWANISAARKAGLKTVQANILSEHTMDEIPLEGLGRLLALTPNDEVNSLSALHFADLFGRAEVYQLPPEGGDGDRSRAVPSHLRGRLLFAPGATHAEMSRRFAAGAVIKRTKLTPEFDYEAFRGRYEGATTPLFLVLENGSLVVFTVDNPPTPRPGHTVVHLVVPQERNEGAAAAEEAAASAERPSRG
jgi:NhaP-type Na+/H+ or K+/H+ antiporter